MRHRYEQSPSREKCVSCASAALTICSPFIISLDASPPSQDSIRLNYANRMRVDLAAFFNQLFIILGLTWNNFVSAATAARFIDYIDSGLSLKTFQLYCHNSALISLFRARSKQYKYIYTRIQCNMYLYNVIAEGILFRSKIASNLNEIRLWFHEICAG